MLLKLLPNSVKKNMPNHKNLNVVFDSVIWISAFVTEEGLARALFDQCVEKADLYTTEEILQEIQRVLLEKEHLRSRFAYDDTEVDEFITRLRDECSIVSPLPEIRVIQRDPNDDIIIACAIAAAADYIISRDHDLLDLGVYQGIQIVSPEAFMQILRGL